MICVCLQEESGQIFVINGDFKLYGTIALKISADNLASSACVRFKEGSSAYCFCHHAQLLQTRLRNCELKISCAPHLPSLLWNLVQRRDISIVLSWTIMMGLIQLNIELLDEVF